MILKQGSTGFKTTDDLNNGYLGGLNHNSVSIGGTNATTNISINDVSKHLPNLSMLLQINSTLSYIDKSLISDLGDQLLLPSIKSVRKQQQSPFKGFLDTSGFA
jgi:hypothetical protein